VKWLLSLFKTDPWTAWIGAAIAILSVGGVIYALIVRPGDLTFLERDGHELKWTRSDLPISCFHAADLPGKYLEAYESVRQEVKREVGDLLGPCVPWALQEALRWAPDGSVYLKLRDAEEDVESHGAVTQHRFDKRDGRILSATVSFDRELEGETLRRAALHEFGHVFGLDHDRERSSIMYPTLDGGGTAFSSRDVDALRKTYVE